MRICLLILCYAFGCAAAQATTPLEQIRSMLALPNVLCGHFDQTKNLVGLKNSVASNGRFCVVSEKGILWRTLKPFPNTLRLTRSEIVQFQQGRVSMRLNASQEPTVRTINGIIFALLTGDLVQLEKLFRIDATVRDNSWNVALKPQDSGVAKALDRVVLTGAVYVKTVVIDEASGDRTTINFSEIRTGETAIAPEEAALFD